MQIIEAIRKRWGYWRRIGALILQARELLGQLTGAHWREEAQKPDIEIYILLISIGIAHRQIQREREKAWGVCLN
jgi:hypothetical protein